MNCEQFELLMIDYIHGELNLELNKHIESHIENCKICKKSYEDSRSIVRDLHDISNDITADSREKEFLKENLLRELRIHRANSPFLSGLHRKKEEMKIQLRERLNEGDIDSSTG